MRTVSRHSFKMVNVLLALLLAIFGMAVILPAQTNAGYYECPTTSTVMTSLGTVNFVGSGVCVTDPVALANNNLPCSVPAGYSFPYGMVYFGALITSADGVGRITIQVQNPLPLNAKYYNCVNGLLADISSQFTRVNEYTVVLSITTSGYYTMGVGFPQTSAAPQSSSPWLPEASKAPVKLSNISVKSASLSATKVAPGEHITVTANIANTGTGNGTSVIKVYVNGSEDATQGVSVNSGSTSTVTFDVIRNEPGTYTVYVGGTQAGSFTVDQFTPNTILFISGALVFFALIIGVIYMTSRRRAQG